MAIKPHGERHINYWNQGITPSDVEHIEDLCDEAGRDIANIMYQFNNMTGFWEVFEPTTRGPAKFRRLTTGIWTVV